MLQLRRLILAALVLHLTASASPSAAVLLCLSADGHTAIEFAAPGTVRCDDPDCQPGMASADEPSCRDIPVLSASEAVAKTSSASVSPPPACLTAPSAIAIHAATLGVALIGRQPAPLLAARALRSVILIL